MVIEHVPPTVTDAAHPLNETVGAVVSKPMLNVELAELLLPTESVNEFAPTKMDAVPEEFEVGVKIAVYDVPDPLNDESAPPDTVTSPATKFDDDSDNVNVTVVVSPLFKEPEPDRSIEMVGDVESLVNEIVREVPDSAGALPDVVESPPYSATYLKALHEHSKSSQ